MFLPKTYAVESVTVGHPDKICDQISDAILDACLTQDPESRVAMEAFGSHGHLIVGGEITTHAEVDYGAVAKRVYNDVGYSSPVEVSAYVVRQSPDIAQGVDTGGAGDQGIMYGYATNETPEYMPKAVVIVHKLAQGLEKLRRSGEVKWLRPDGKTQVTMENGKIKNLLVSTQHSEDVGVEEIKSTLIQKLIVPLLGDISGIEILVNPTGKFVIGADSFEADTGLTGRKIMVDTYGGLIPHGGGCFSGKDPSKVDRSGAYMARFVAKQIVAGGHADECLVSVAYAIGRAEPLMVHAVDGAGRTLSDLAMKFDFRPRAIIERLNLRRPIYRETAAYGHFGRPGFPWEEINQGKVV